MTTLRPTTAAILAGAPRSYLDEEIPFGAPPVPPDPPGSSPIPPSPPDVPFVLNDDQARAVDEIVAWRFSPTGPRFLKLAGPAGTGKTVTLKEVRRRLFGTRTAWAAMTGKAAARVRDAADIPCKTLHSVLYHPPREVDRPDEEKVDLEFDHVRRDVHSCLLVCDESSMAGPKIRSDLDRSPFEKVLLVGDHWQIPPVLSKKEEEERGDDYSIFEGVPGPTLIRIMRTSGAVLEAATVVRQEQRIPTDGASFGGSEYRHEEVIDPNAAIDRAVQLYMQDGDGDKVIITWRNAPRLEMNREIRARLGLPPGFPAEGEMMVVRRNVHKHGLMNGDVVRIDKWLVPGPTLAGVETRYARAVTDSGARVVLLVPSASFDGALPYVGLSTWKAAIEAANCEEPTPLTWSYVLTCHMGQGSEWRRAIVVLPGDLSHPHFRKPTRLPDGGVATFAMRFAYTALTRAKSRADLIVSR